MINYETIKQNQTVNTYITEADKALLAMGYTEHSFAHVGKVASDAAYILKSINRPEREIELAKLQRQYTLEQQRAELQTNIEMNAADSLCGICYIHIYLFICNILIRLINHY